MKILIGTAGIPGSAEERSTPAGIRRVKELGLQSMEVEFVRGVNMKPGLAREAGKVASELGIRLSVHAPYYINLCNPEKAKDSQKRIIDSCYRGHLMGSEVIVFHPGYYGSLEKEEAFDMVGEACREMADVIEENEWKVKLGLESTGKVSQFGTVDEILGICKRNKLCIPVIDWAHLFAKYQGKLDFKSILSKVISAGYDRLHTHFSNIDFTEKGERRHLTLESKQPDFKDVAKIVLKSSLKEINIISESPDIEGDALVMKGVFEKLGHKF
ncbi:MAG: TIM barrel protein [Candidatus Aenigmatarchaeota archaeon]|nr:MAG: TIM barrel protein [Candidatus Aenigmarchaeota archaeon]